MTPRFDSGLVRAVVFDLDGTLYDQRPLRRRMAIDLVGGVVRGAARISTFRMLSAFRSLREELAEREAEDVAGLQYGLVAERLGVAPAAVEAAVTVWMHERPLRYLAGCRAPGAPELIDDLRSRGISTAVLSDYRADAKLRALGLCVDVVVSAEDPEVNRLKPHPKGLERVLARLSVDPANTLLVGDRPERDGAVAARCAVPFLRKVWGRAALEGEVADLGDLIGIVGARPPREVRGGSA